MAAEEKRGWHLTLLNKPKVCSLPGYRGYGWEGKREERWGKGRSGCIVCGC